MLKTKKKQAIIKKVQAKEGDTGSVGVQIALLSAKIDELAKHLKKHKKDNHSRRGLIGLVATRRKHLKYLEKNDKKQYDAAIKQIKN